MTTPSKVDGRTYLSVQPNIKDVEDFQHKFGVPHRQYPGLIEASALEFKLGHLREELVELSTAARKGDIVETVDGLVDLVYVAYGLAIALGVDPEVWQQCWDEVHRSNMRKVRVDRPQDSKRGHAWDVVKPRGWQKPDLKPILEHAKQLSLGLEGTDEAA